MSLSILILLPLLGAILNGAHALIQAMRRQGPRAWLVNLFGVGLPFAAFGLALYLGIPFLQGRGEPLTEEVFRWMSVGHFQVEAALVLDRLSVLMALIVTGVGSLIHLYSVGYMEGDPGYAKYFAYLNLFLAAMLILVLADNLLLMFVGWEGVGLCSYLLIGYWFEDPAKAAAGKKAFVVNRVGDFGFLLGIFAVIAILLPQSQVPASILNFHYMQQHASLLAGTATLITLFLFIGAVGKSAQIPLYVWLPDAMAGPTPVSALIHAATMVTAGIYMIARLGFLYDLAPRILELVALVGALTAFFAASIAVVQNDIKKVLAYSTVSQLGYMFLAMGVGSYSTGLFHLMTHAFFKACLFLGAGSVIHALSGQQDIRHMGALRRAMPVTAVTFVFATLAISGIPPFSGFFSKDEILWETFHRGHTALGVLAAATAVLTSFYMWRLTVRTFFGVSRVPEADKAHLHESPRTMTWVLMALGLLSLVGGLVGVPHILGGHHYLRDWLGLGQHLPQDALADRQEMILMVISVSNASLAALGAALLYLKYPEAPARWARKFHRGYRLLLNKYYVDEIYDATLIQPIKRGSEHFLNSVVDGKFIDGTLVNGSAKLASWMGSLVSRFQNGLINAYALYFLMAIAGFVLFWVIL